MLVKKTRLNAEIRQEARGDFWCSCAYADEIENHFAPYLILSDPSNKEKCTLECTKCHFTQVPARYTAEIKKEKERAFRARILASQ